MAAVEGIRRHDKAGKIVLIDEQGEPLYSKINLHFLLNGKMSPEQLYLKKQDFYTQNAVELVRAKPQSLDGFEYEKLILATGGFPRGLDVEGADLSGIHTFYSLEDAKKLTRDIEDAKDILVVGGGFITLDVVDSLQQMGKNIHLVVRDSQLLRGRVGSRGAKILFDNLNNNVKCYFETEATKFVGNQQVEAVVLLGGEKVNCQQVIMAIGIVPNLSLAKALNLKIGRGVIVDEFQRTNIENVYAAGDICEFLDRSSGESMMAGNWFYAMESGKVAGENAAGGNMVNEAVPIVSKNLLGTNLFFVGNVDDKFEKREFFSEKKYFCAFIKDSVLVGASAIGLPTKMGLAKAVLGKQFELTKEQISD